MKKSHELATLTGSQVMVLVASETGHVYTFSTEKFRPILNSKPGRKLIQTCLANETVDEAEMGDIDLTEIDPVSEDKSANPLMNHPLALPETQSPGSSSQSSNEAPNLSPPHAPEFRTLVVQGRMKTAPAEEARKRSFEHALKPRMASSLTEPRITEIEPGEANREPPGGIRYSISRPANHASILTHNNDVPSDEEVPEGPIPSIPDGYQLGAIHPVYLRQTKIPHSTKTNLLEILMEKEAINGASWRPNHHGLKRFRDGTEYEMTYLHQGAGLPPEEAIPNHVHLMHKSRLFKAFPPHSSHTHANLPHSSKR